MKIHRLDEYFIFMKKTTAFRKRRDEVKQLKGTTSKDEYKKLK
jgi:hypothetical protein